MADEIGPFLFDPSRWVVTPSGDMRARCTLVRAGRWNGFDVFAGPTLPIGAAELRCGDQVVRIRHISEPEPRP